MTYDTSEPAARQAPAAVTPAPQPQSPGDVQASLDRADAELNAVYRRLMLAAGPTQQKQLRENEREWIKRRDAEADGTIQDSPSAGGDQRVNRLLAMTNLIQQRTRTLAALEGTGAFTSPRTTPAGDGGPSSGLQKRLPNGAVADPYANYTTVHAPSTQPVRQSPPPLPAPLARVYTVPELKQLSGTKPTGAGLRGDFVLVSREGDRVLLQSRLELSDFGVTSFTNGKADVYRGRTFVNVTCRRDIGPLIRGQLVSVPAEQPLRIVSVSTNSQGRIDVEALF